MKNQQNIPYINPKNKGFHNIKHRLDIFHPVKAGPLKVMVFVHGGTWVSGDKELYSQLGENFARHGFVSVVINYRLATDFRTMTGDVAAAIKWVYDNISEYNGDKNKIFLCGHSAGGHLASLATLDPEYFNSLDTPNPVKGAILLDAFGLNIASFILSHGSQYMHYVSQIFGENREVWEKASPVNFVSKNQPPFLIYTGTETYPFLINDNKTFIGKLNATDSGVSYRELSGLSHTEMVMQLKDVSNPLFEQMTEFADNPDAGSDMRQAS